MENVLKEIAEIKNQLDDVTKKMLEEIDEIKNRLIPLEKYLEGLKNRPGKYAVRDFCGEVIYDSDGEYEEYD